MAQKINVGIVGLGRSGRDIHGPALAGRPDYAIAAVADTIEERLAKARADWGCRTYRDYREMLGDTDVELVVVATPSHTHAAIAVEALKAGKNVLVEKPMAVSAAEADAMIAAARAAGRLLTVFHNRRFDEDFLAVRKAIASGRLGPVHYIRRGVYSYVRRTDWQAVRKYGGGLLNNWGPHLIDQILILLNHSVRGIFADCRLTISAGDAEDHIKVVFRGAEAIADMELTSCCAIPQPSWVVLGRYGTATARDGVLTVRWCDPAKLKPLPEIGEIPPFSDYTFPSEKIEWMEETTPFNTEDFSSSNAGFYTALHAAMREGGPVPARPEETRMVIEYIEKIRAGG